MANSLDVLEDNTHAPEECLDKDLCMPGRFQFVTRLEASSQTRHTDTLGVQKEPLQGKVAGSFVP
jgi:hypothetical protein